MVRFQRTASVARGRGPEALTWANEVTAYVNKSQKPPNPLHAWVQRYGQTGVIVWTWDFDGVAVLDQQLERLLADSGNQEMIRKAADYFVEGSIVDQMLVMRT